MGALPSPPGRPRLREDVRFAPTPDGVYLHSDHGSCLLRGQDAHDLVSRLASVLDGRRTLAELTSRLSDHQRRTVQRLVAELIKHRMVVEERPPSPHHLTDDELTRYHQEIAFIGYALDSPHRRFQRVRHCRTLLTGDSALLGALVTAMIGSGWRDLLVATGDPAVARLVTGALTGARRDPAQRVRVTPPDSDSTRPWQHDLVVTVASDPEALIDVCASLPDPGTAVAQMLLRPREAWLAPVGVPDHTGAESGWRRLRLDPGTAGAGDDYLTGPVPAVLAGMLTLACFAYLTGLDELGRGEPATGLTRVDLRNLDTRIHRFLRHPLASPSRSGSDAPSESDPPDGTTSLTAEAVLAHTDSLVDPKLGVLATLDEEALAQVPLAVCRARLHDPTPHRPRWSPLPEVVGWGQQRQTARLRTMLGALAAAACLATRAAAAPSGHHGGTALPGGAARLVPLPPVPRTADGRPELPAGLGAGLRWEQALAAAIRGHCEDAVRDRAGPGDGSVVALPDTYLARLVETTGEPVEVRDLTAVLDVPAFSFRLSGELVAVSVAATAEAAMREGLERSLLAWQSRTRRQSGYRQVRPWWYDAAATGQADDPYGVRLMSLALHRCGRLPVAVPLHGDPELARLIPHLVEVVLVDA